MKKLTEHDLQNSIIEYLRRKKFFVMRLNSGAVKTQTGFMRLAEAGTPDLMAFKLHLSGMKLYFIEVKLPGKKPTIAQQTKMHELETYGAVCMVIHSLEELTENL